MKGLFLILIALTVLFVSCQQPVVNISPAAPDGDQSRAAWNITGSTFTHDPTIIKEGSTYWQFYTAPGIGVKYSTNGTNWTNGTKVFASNLSWWSQYVGTVTDVRAPDVFYANGRYNLYYACSKFGSNTSIIGLVSCSSIAKGDWRDDGLIMRSTSSSAYNCIDPEYINGYMAFGSFLNGINIVQVSTTTFKPTGTPKVTAWDYQIESPSIVKNGNYYHLFVSKGLCCKGTSSTYDAAGKTVVGAKWNNSPTFTIKKDANPNFLVFSKPIVNQIVYEDSIEIDGVYTANSSYYLNFI